MEKRRHELDSRVLAVFLLVAIPFVGLGSFLAMGMAKGALRDSIGADLEQRAVEARVLVERFVDDEVVHLHVLSVDPRVRQAVRASEREPAAEELRRQEQAWGAGERGLTASLVGSPLAGYLRELAQIRSGLKLLQVIDGRGRLVASSSRGGRLLNGETALFKAVTQEGFLRPYVGDIAPTSSGRGFFEIGYPIVDPSEGTSIGVLRAVVDAAALYSVLAPIRLGRTGHALLLRGDGLILASDDGERVLKAKFPGFQYLRAAREERRAHWILPEVSASGTATTAGAAPGIPEAGAPATGAEMARVPRRIAGFSPVEPAPNVGWMVVVEQDLDEATAPIQGAARYLWMHIIGAFVTVILLAVYFSFKLEAPVIEEELHLHPEHVPTGRRHTA